MTPGTRPKSFKCKFFKLELYGSPTVIKRHIGGPKCTLPTEERRVLLQRLVANKRKAGDDMLQAELADMEATAGSPDSRARMDTASGSAVGPFTSATGPLLSMAKVLTFEIVEAVDSLCTQWMYRNAVPLLTTESSAFRALAWALNPAYWPPSRWS